MAFSFYTVALIKFIGERSHSYVTTTALAIFTVALPSIIQIIGTPIAGFAFDRLGPHWLYLVSVAGYILGVIIMQAARSQPTAGDAIETL